MSPNAPGIRLISIALGLVLTWYGAYGLWGWGGVVFVTGILLVTDEAIRRLGG